MLNLDRSTVKHDTQNIQNYCNQWLSESFRVHQFVFGRGSVPDPNGGAYSASPDPLSGLRGPTSKVEGRERRKGEMKGRWMDGKDHPLRKILDPPWKMSFFVDLFVSYSKNPLTMRFRRRTVTRAIATTARGKKLNDVIGFCHSMAEIAQISPKWW